MIRHMLALALAGLASFATAAVQPIPSEFPVMQGLHAAAIPPDNGADPVGAFRFICGSGPVNRDDPIVYPGQPGKSHWHQYYGATTISAFDTYKTLRSAGRQSTCNNGPFALNRSGYWMPAMMDGKGHFVQPDYVSIYYKRIPASNPMCNDPARTDLKAEGICVAIPDGLKMIWGYDMVTNTPPTGHFSFDCYVNNRVVSTNVNLTPAILGCPVGGQVKTQISAPPCWDGKNLDSPNHRSHVSYPAYGTWGYLRCDAAHPYLMPTFTMGVFYTVRAGDDLSLWHFSSDEMRPNLPYGSTFHADFFAAWDHDAEQMWVDNCINRHLNCSSGNLGNGFQLIGAWAPAYGYVNPNARMDVPAIRR